eukprot:TRINITY_DN12759_c0_g1_i1.p2 TRINITY_DN12759_c0_g1~~TRINITY_DN12759_c0_g1_i1.p2  ORF type:complete len:568 (-),score=188.98 TRINITY_DN12759_c0_g1_i1:152-1828(-)
MEPTIETVTAERDQLKKELDELKASLAPKKIELPEDKAEISLKHRTPLRTLFAKDQGVSYIDHAVCVCGWVKTIREQGRGTFAFVKVGDGSVVTELQAVVNQETVGWDDVKSHKISTASSVLLIGDIIKSSGKGQAIELKCTEIRLLGECSPTEYPLAAKAHTVEFLRELGHLRPRTTLISSITRIRNALAFATHKYFQEMGFFYVNTPIITASDCEGAGEMFQLTTLLLNKQKTSEIATREDKIDYSKDFFGRPAFLTVSGQLNGEIYACSMGSIYTFGPTFRAEYSNTSRHLAEFWMIEPEIAFADLFENMDVAEGYVKYTLKYAMETCPDEFAFLEGYEKTALLEKKKQIAELQKKEEQARKEKGEAPQKKKKMPDVRGFKATPLRERIQAVIDSKFARVTYTEAIEILEKSGVEFEEKPYWGIDMGSEHERWLAETYYKCPTVVYNYPKDFKAFYMRLNDDQKTVAAMDVLVPGVGELIGGSQREERLDVLIKMLEEKGLHPEDYSWYLDLRRFGSVVHSGFGLGFERLVCYATGVENIREVIPFPRWPGHAEF